MSNPDTAKSRRGSPQGSLEGVSWGQGPCNLHSQPSKMERFSRVCALVAQSYFCSTRGKCDRYLAVQAIAKYFDPSHPKLLAAYNKLIPKHRGSKGIANYPACTFGYGMTPVKGFAEQQRARGRTWLLTPTPRKDRYRQPVSSKGHHEEAVNRTLLRGRKSLRKAEAEGGEIKVATDGSFHEREGRGSVGVNGTAYSTDAELCALMVLATALDAVQPQATVTPRSDSQSAIARTRNPRKGDPVAADLRNIPVVQWAGGHRDNADIDAADGAATNAHRSNRSFDIEWCYRAGKVTRLCRRRQQQPDDNDEANDLVQLEESGRFLRRSRNCSRDMAVLTDDGASARKPSGHCGSYTARRTCSRPWSEGRSCRLERARRAPS
ncbi:hypothetical protein DIPPA_27736 [Diplonema papillatum]|nr:hypothetical protein DIPPA_27736 [Diplonema papillatum]